MPGEETTTSSGPVELVPQEEATSSSPETPVPTAEPTVVPAKPLDLKTYQSDIKIVITLSKKTVMIGLQRADCDPQFFQVKDLEGAVKGIPVFVDMAEKVWTKTPRYFKAAEPPAPVAPAKPPAVPAKAATTTTTANATKPATPAAPKEQPGMPGL